MEKAPQSRYEFIPVGTVWPSGDFSVGFKRIDKVGTAPSENRPVDVVFREGAAKVASVEMQARLGYYRSNPGAIIADLEAEQVYQNAGLYQGEGDSLSPLDLTDASNSHKPANRPEKYGKLGMTGYGKKMVRSACTILERRFRGRLTFATVTMPTLPPDKRRALALVWSELVRQLLQWLSRRLARRRLPSAVCSVSEVQPGRLQAGNGGYLHLHLVWPNIRNQGGFYTVHPLEVRAWCEKFLISRGIWEEGAWVNCDTQDVRKSAAAYLSKYMSKGGDTLEQFAEENGWDSVPGQWWNVTKPMRDAVKAELVKGSVVGSDLVLMIEDCVDNSDGSPFWSLRTVDMEYDGRYITVGYCGILKAEYVRYYTEAHLVTA